MIVPRGSSDVVSGQPPCSRLIVEPPPGSGSTVQLTSVSAPSSLPSQAHV